MRKLLLFFIFISFFSCSHDTNTDVINIDFSLKKEYLLSNIVDSVKTIKLETSKDNLISRISAFYKDETFLFIVDKKQQTIFIFSDKGKYISKINAVGRGDGEYGRIGSICLNRYKKQLEIVDVFQKKILIYDYQGKFLNAKKYNENIAIMSFCALKNGHYLFMHPMYDYHHNMDVWEVDSLYRRVKVLKGHNSKYKYPLYSCAVENRFENNVDFYNCFDNKMYRVSKDTVDCLYKFKLKQEISKDLVIKKDMNIEEYNKADLFYVNNRMSSLEKYCVLDFFSNKRDRALVVLNKTNKELIVIDSINNDIDKNLPMSLDLFSYDKNAVCSFSFPENSEDNPVIQILYFN